MDNTLKSKKKSFSLPHVYIVILILMLIITVMTYVIPAGSYTRVDGNVDPNSFAYVEQTPVGFMQFFTSLHQGFVESANIMYAGSWLYPGHQYDRRLLGRYPGHDPAYPG